MNNQKQLLALAFYCLSSMVQAGEKEELLKLRNTTTNLINELVKQGVITGKVADEMIKRAEADAVKQVDQQATSSKQAQGSARQEPTLEPGEVRVPYVPEFVKDEIRQQVRSELRADVVKDVMKEAKTQQWGMPNALPDWISRIKFSGDVQLRSQGDYYGKDNQAGSFFNAQAINNAGGITNAGLNAFLNTTQDQQRFRERLRLAMDANITDGLKVGLRLATGNINDPVSTNQTLGNTGQRYQFNVDRAFIKYDAANNDGFNWLTLVGGRIVNPWYVGGNQSMSGDQYAAGGSQSMRRSQFFGSGSELVWDTDLAFEGFAITARHLLGNPNNIYEVNGNSKLLYATVGAFPIQTSGITKNNKWLFGGQVGMDLAFANQDNFKMGAAYYDYQNIKAVPNNSTSRTCNDTSTPDNSFSTPQFIQGGNSQTTICLEGTRTSPGQFPGAIGLASDFKILNFNAAYNLSLFAPYQVLLSADFAKNIGFNHKDILARLNQDISDQTNAWQVRMDLGWNRIDRFGQWNLFALYKYVQRDAVLDAYSDSNFHLGGTNAKGWVAGGNYGLMRNLWLSGTWLSTDTISGPKYGVDTLLLDINTRF